MLELYHHGSSVCAAKVRLVLYEKGLDWTPHYIDVLKGEQFAPDYVALNPNAVVPTLVHDGRIVCESTVIAEYLDEMFANPPLKPADAYARARMRIWTKRVDESLHPMTSVITYVVSHRHDILANHATAESLAAYIGETRDPVKRARKREWVEMGLKAPDALRALETYSKTLDDMDAALAGAPYLAGNTYSLADIGLTPYVNRLSMLAMEPIWQARPNVAAWFERIRTRPNFAPAIRQWIPEPLARALKTNGEKSWPEIREMAGV